VGSTPFSGTLAVVSGLGSNIARSFVTPNITPANPVSILGLFPTTQLISAQFGKQVALTGNGSKMVVVAPFTSVPSMYLYG